MIKWFFLLVSILSCKKDMSIKLFHSQNKPQSEGVPFYILAGQSNLGRSRVSQMTGGQAALYDVTYTDVFMFNYSLNTTAFEPLNIGTNTRLLNYNHTDEFGFEASLFKELRAHKTGELFVLKQGDGGTSMATRWLPPSGPDWEFLTDLSLDAIATWADANGKSLNLKAFIWMQGEEDAVVEAYANAYEANLGTFFSTFDTYWSGICTTYGFPNDGYRKVIGQIEGASDPVQTYYATVRTAQANFCANGANNATLIDVTPYGVVDGVHMGATGQISFGLDIFEVIKDL